MNKLEELTKENEKINKEIQESYERGCASYDAIVKLSEENDRLFEELTGKKPRPALTVVPDQED